jgi:hypothetical protein
MFPNTAWNTAKNQMQMPDINKGSWKTGRLFKDNEANHMPHRENNKVCQMTTTQELM